MQPCSAAMEFSFTEQVRAQPTFILLLSTLGFISLTRISINLLKWVYVNFLRPGKDLKKSYGSWALVTGATDGIGKAIAFELARKGLHLVLVGRNPDKLRDVSEAIKAVSCSTQIRDVVVDLSGDLGDGMLRLREAIGGLDVGVLVNNAGMSYPNPMYFHEVEERVWKGVVKVNAEAATMVTRVVVPGMLERRRGAIVNIGSGSSVAIPSFPLYAVYACTKAYIDQFSKSLYVEYKDMGIDVQCQIPLFVATKMLPLNRFSIFATSPIDYARATLRWIGNEPLCTPYWAHSVQCWVLSLLPNFILNSINLQVVISMRSQDKDLMKE